MKALNLLSVLPLLFIVTLSATSQNCTLTCPSNIIIKAEANKGGSTVNYPAITNNEACGAITYTPSSGSFFRIGSTSVIASTASGQKCSFTVTVTDNESPILTPIKLSPKRIWPANGKMKEVALHYTFTDNAPETTCNVTVASNDEKNGVGNYEIVNAHLVRLKASRLPNGQPRTYSITVTCTDASGNISRRTTGIMVARQSSETN
jgi:hypothetical protein